MVTVPFDHGRAVSEMVAAAVRLGLCGDLGCRLDTLSDTRDDVLGARTIVARCAMHGVLRPVVIDVGCARSVSDGAGLERWRAVAFLRPKDGR